MATPEIWSAEASWLALHRAGHIRLPEKRFTPNNPIAKRTRPSYPEIDETLFATKLNKGVGIQVELAREKSESQIHDTLIEHHHYLGYTQPVGHQIKYLIRYGDRVIGAVSFSSPPRHIGCRDKHIG